MGAGLLAVKSGFILFIKSYQFSLQINTLERERERVHQKEIQKKKKLVYYVEIKREPNRRLINRCDERLRAKADESTRLAYTGLRRNPKGNPRGHVVYY
jgi:hypothetical protein